MKNAERVYKDDSVLLLTETGRLESDKIGITVEEFRSKCLSELEKKGKKNTISIVMVNNIMDLYTTSLECKKDIQENGVMREMIGSTGQITYKKNESVGMQEKNISSIAKLLAQLGLDNLVEEQESQF